MSKMNAIENVVAITPVWNEALVTIQKFERKMEKVKRQLNKKGVAFRYFFLSDAAINLPKNSPVLIRHSKNERLAQTLLDGYAAVLRHIPDADLVVRIDCQEHDPQYIIKIVEHFSETNCQSMVLPVWYWEKDNLPSMQSIYGQLDRFWQGLNKDDETVILETYNQVFPMGYQAYRTQLLSRLYGFLVEGQKKYEEMFKEKMSWGLDLLVLLLAVELNGNWDVMFSGFMPPWQENRGADKIAAQKDKALKMLKVFKSLTGK